MPEPSTFYAFPSNPASNWPAAGFNDTELGVSLKPEVCHGATQVYARV